MTNKKSPAATGLVPAPNIDNVRSGDAQYSESNGVKASPPKNMQFAMIPGLLYDDPRLSNADRNIYGVVAQYARGPFNGPPRVSTVSQPKIAKRLGTDQSNVSRHLAKLGTTGWLRKLPVPRGSCHRYELTYPSWDIIEAAIAAKKEASGDEDFGPVMPPDLEELAEEMEAQERRRFSPDDLTDADMAAEIIGEQPAPAPLADTVLKLEIKENVRLALQKCACPDHVDSREWRSMDTDARYSQVFGYDLPSAPPGFDDIPPEDWAGISMNDQIRIFTGDTTFLEVLRDYMGHQV